MKHWPLFLIAFVTMFVGYTKSLDGSYPNAMQLMAVSIGYGILVFTIVFAVLILIQLTTGIEMGLFKEWPGRT